MALSFQDTVLALTSLIFFFRFNELSGTVANDASPNAFVADYFPTATLGRPSPLETDPSSFAVQGPVAHLPVVDGSLADVRGNFTWMVFGYLAEDDGNDNNVLFCRNGQIGLGLSNYVAFNNGNVEVALSISSIDYTLGYSVANLVRGTWYFLRVTRNGALAKLHVNEQLVDSQIITTDDIDADNWASDGWYFGVSQSSSAWSALGIDEAILVATAISDADGLAVYESALASTAMSGTATASPSAILYSDIEPAPVNFPFRHNWDDALIERITFRTGISTAVKGYESANAQRPKPRREIEISQVLRDNDERQSFRAKLTANQKRKWFIPILEDREWLTATLSAGSTVIPATAQYRDYEVGGYVELRQLNALGQVVKQEYALITALSPLTTTAITNIYDAGSSISPARRGILEAQLSPRGHTDAVEEVSLVVRLIAEDEQITPNRITLWTPTITYHGYEVFDPATWQSNDWTELRDYGVEQPRREVDFNVGTFSIDSDTIASFETFSYRMLLDTRAQQAALLGWFYARQGAGKYLWVPSVQRDFNVISAASANLTVEKHNYSENFASSEFRRDLAFVYHNNTMVLRRINSVSLSGVNEILALDNNVPTLTNLRSVSYLRFCRFDGDTLEIARATNTKARFAWGFRELLSSPV